MAKDLLPSIVTAARLVRGKQSSVEYSMKTDLPFSRFDLRRNDLSELAGIDMIHFKRTFRCLTLPREVVCPSLEIASFYGSGVDVVPASAATEHAVIPALNCRAVEEPVVL